MKCLHNPDKFKILILRSMSLEISFKITKYVTYPATLFFSIWTNEYVTFDRCYVFDRICNRRVTYPWRYISGLTMLLFLITSAFELFQPVPKDTVSSHKNTPQRMYCSGKRRNKIDINYLLVNSYYILLHSLGIANPTLLVWDFF